MSGKKKKYIMLWIGLLVSIVALWWSTRQVILSEFISEMKNFNLWWLVPAFVSLCYSMYLRAVRWGLFFEPYHHLKGYQVFRPLMICFGFNCLFPGRVGEVARAYIVGTRSRTGVTTALATVVAERVLDSITLIGLLAFSLAILPKMDPNMPPIQVWGYSVKASQFNELSRIIVIFSLVLVSGTIVFMIPLTQFIMHRIIENHFLIALSGTLLATGGIGIMVLKKLPAPVGLAVLVVSLLVVVGAFVLPALRHKLLAYLQDSQAQLRLKNGFHHLLDQFAQGFHALQRPWMLAQILFHSLLLWVLLGASNLMVAMGFGLPMNLAQAMALMVIIGIFIAIPASPGYWGLFEAGTIFSLFVLRVLPVEKQSLALAYALTIHLVQLLPVVGLGLLFAWQLQVKPAKAEALD